MSVFKTEIGTQLPIMQLKGKDYLQVAYRVLWFRELHPDWSIETDIVYRDEKYALVRATIKNESGRIMAQAHKDCSLASFREFVVKAETGAIGRALGLVGCATQFCTQDLDEEPEENDPAHKDPNHYSGVDSGLERPKASPAIRNPLLDPKATPSDQQALKRDYEGFMREAKKFNWGPSMIKNYIVQRFKKQSSVELNGREWAELQTAVFSKSYADALKEVENGK